MPPLTAIERFFERLFERPSARLFHARLQPVQLQRRIERAMEGERLTTSDRTLVPNRFVVHLHPTDLAEFGDMTGTLASELADGALSFARAHRYTVVDRPRVDLLADPTIERTDIRVDARFAEPIAGRAGHGPVALTPSGETATDPIDPSATRVYSVPKPRTPRAVLRVTDPDGRTRDVVVEGGSLTIGRAVDNDFVAVDGRVSRHHGRIVGRRGTLVYEDLGSTNGSRVNGEPVTEVVLGVGDRLEVGDTALVVEVAGAPD
jgi:FhaA, N-terminal domain/FHA domain